MRRPSQNALDAAMLIVSRDAAGLAKYGTSMDRDDLRPGEWLQHMIEEHADALQYGLRLKRKLEQIVRTAYTMGYDDGRLGNELVVDQVVQELIG